MSRVRFSVRELVVDKAETLHGTVFDDVEPGAAAEWYFSAGAGLPSLADHVGVGTPPRLRRDFQGGEHVALDSVGVVDGLHDDVVGGFRGIEEDGSSADDRIPAMDIRVRDLVGKSGRVTFSSAKHRDFAYRLVVDLLVEPVWAEIVAAPSSVWHLGERVSAITRGPQRRIVVRRGDPDVTYPSDAGTVLRTTTGATLASSKGRLVLAYTDRELGPETVRVAIGHPDGAFAAQPAAAVLCEASFAPAVTARQDEVWMAVAGRLIGFSFGPSQARPADELHVFRSTDGGYTWMPVVSSTERCSAAPAIAVSPAGRLYVAWAGADGVGRLNLGEVVLDSSRSSGSLVVPPQLRGVSDATITGPSLGFVGDRAHIGWIGTDPEQRVNSMLLVDDKVWAGIRTTETAASSVGPCFMPPSSKGWSPLLAWVNGTTIDWPWNPSPGGAAASSSVKIGAISTTAV